jgi:hypothetical protein
MILNAYKIYKLYTEKFSYTTPEPCMKPLSKA